MIRTATQGWLAKWMGELAEEMGKIKVEGYELQAEAGKGPEVLVTVTGGAEDTTAAKKARQAITKVMAGSIKKNTSGIPGFDAQVRSFNKGADLVLECTVRFP